MLPQGSAFCYLVGYRRPPAYWRRSEQRFFNCWLGPDALTMKIVVPFGFYGWGNIGDESTLQGFARLTAKHYRVESPVWVASRNPSHTARIEPSFKYYNARGRNFHGWWARRRAGVYVFAGGTPIMDILGSYPLAEVVPIVTTGSRRRKRIVFVGIGTETLHREESRRTLSEIIAPKVHHWSVRCQRDRDRLKEYGVPSNSITVAADMAWLLDPVSSSWGREYLLSLGIDTEKPLIGINVNNEPFMQREAPDLLEQVGRFLDEFLKNHHATALFFCNDASEGITYDKAASATVRNSMKKTDETFLIPNHYWSPQQMLSLVACCQVTISTRYHFCLFSALQGIPFIALQRSDKVADLCWDLKWPHGLPIKCANCSKLLDHSNEIQKELSPVILRNSITTMRERALRNQDTLDSLDLRL